MTEVKKEDVVKILHTYPLCRVSKMYFANIISRTMSRRNKSNVRQQCLINRGGHYVENIIFIGRIMFDCFKIVVVLLKKFTTSFHFR